MGKEDEFMILFEIDWATDADSGSYLTVGNDTDTEEMIKDRERNKDDWKSAPWFGFFEASKVASIDGYRILVGEKLPEVGKAK